MTFNEEPVLSTEWGKLNTRDAKLKRIQDITENWVVKGVEEADFMRLQQSAVKQRNNQGKELDFDIDWETLQFTPEYKIIHERINYVQPIYQNR